MRGRWKRMPKALRLGLDLLVVALLLALVWASMGYPCLSAGSAFRRGLRQGGVRAVDPETFVELPYGRLGLAVDQNAVFFCPVRRADLGWQPDGSGQRWPALENGYLAPLLMGLRPYPGSTTWNLFVNGPVAAVKADSPRTELTLVLEDWHSWEEDQRYPGGSYPLIQTLEQDGWRFYGFNDSTRSTDVKPDQDPTLRRFVEWCLGVEDVRPPAFLELRSYDEAGNLLQCCRLPLFPE